MAASASFASSYADGRDLARGGDQVAEHRLALDDPRVVLDVHRGGDHVHHRRQVRRPAHGIQPLAAGELVPQRDKVDRLALCVQREHRLVDVGVLLPIEVGRVEEVRDLQDRVGVDQQRAKDALLGVDRLRRELVDAHGAAGASAAWGNRGLLVGELEMTQRTVVARRPLTSDLSTR